MTSSTPADAVRQALCECTSRCNSDIAAAAIEAATNAILPCPVIDDRSEEAAKARLLRLQFLSLANELTGTPLPTASREALEEALEESQAAAWGDIEPTTPEPAPSPAVAYDAGDGVRIEVTNNERTSWAVRDFGYCLNKGGKWEHEAPPSHRTADFLARTRWPSPEQAYSALLRFRGAKEVQS
jgi:hypothetical protein